MLITDASDGGHVLAVAPKATVFLGIVAAQRERDGFKERNDRESGRMSTALWTAGSQGNFRAKCRVKRQISWRNEAHSAKRAVPILWITEEAHR